MITLKTSQIMCSVLKMIFLQTAEREGYGLADMYLEFDNFFICKVYFHASWPPTRDRIPVVCFETVGLFDNELMNPHWW